RVHRVTRLTVEIALALDDTPSAERGRAGHEHAVAHPDRPRVGVLVLDRAPGRDAAGRRAGAVDGIELDLDQLLGPRQPVDLHERGRGPRIAPITGKRPRSAVGPQEVGDIDGAAGPVPAPAPP